jgi:hypothetical protein
MNLAVFWNAALYSLVYIYRRFRGAYCFHYQDLDRPGDGVCSHEVWTHFKEGSIGVGYTNNYSERHKLSCPQPLVLDVALATLHRNMLLN